MKILKRSMMSLLILLIWTALIAYGTIEGFLLRPLAEKGSSVAFMNAVEEYVQAEFVGNFALALIEDGEISTQFFHSEDRPISENSIFPVASISKWVTAFGVFKLVEQGKLSLDQPIDQYLTRWQLPESEYDHQKVTIRRLLSHSSGLVDDLGYAGFAQNEPVQTLEASLTKASDAPYSEGIARIGYEPGSAYMYSGAGYTILQLIIEEVTQQSFQDYMDQEVFKPLRMTHSSFELSSSMIPIYKDDGTIRPPKKFTALAAAGLTTSTADLSKFLLAHISAKGVLSSKTIQQMSQAETFINETPIYGLGPHLYSQNDPHSWVIGHDGSGNNAINTAARIDLKSQSGIIILETGHHTMASSLADEWLFWKTGVADYVVITRNKSYLLSLLIVGYILLMGMYLWAVNRKKH